MRHIEQITPLGPFSLRAAAGLAFGATEGAPREWDGQMRLAFAVDANPDGPGHAGALLTQAQTGDPVREALGETFLLAGDTLRSFPVPDRLAEVPDHFPGLNSTKIERLRGIAAAAQRGELDVARLHELGPAAACADLQRLAGIGPFSATLIVLRASGFADAWLGVAETRTGEALADLYGPDVDPDAQAEQWRPFRTWALVLVRIASYRTGQRSRPAT